MLYPRCSAMFDKRDARKVKSAQQENKKQNWKGNKPQFYFDKRGVPHKRQQFLTHQKSKPGTYVPTSNDPQGRWLRPTDREKSGHHKWRNFEMGRGFSLTYKKKFQVSKKRSYGPNNYKRNNPMSRTQWRRFQRKKKAKRKVVESSNNKPYQSRVSQKKKQRRKHHLRKIS